MNVFGGDDAVSGVSAVQGLVQRSDGSAIKAVSSNNRNMMDEPGEEVQQPQRSSGILLPSLSSGQTIAPMIVIPAGGLGRSSSRLSPQKSSNSSPRKGSHGRTPSGAVSIDMHGSGGNSRTPTRTPTRELDRLHVENRAPPRFICPISGRIMRDPVILATGTTCDRGALERHLAKGHKRCPVTKRPLKKPIHLIPNIELRQNIAQWAKRNAPWILDKDGLLEPKEPSVAEFQGKDVQYVTPIMDDEEAPGAAGAERSPSRIESGRGAWRYTDGSKVRPGANTFNLNASSGRNALVNSPWQSHRGISSAPRSMRRHRSVSRSISPSKRHANSKRDWWSTGFLATVSIASIVLFIMSLWQGNWKMTSLSENPWYGASSEALASIGAQALPIMEGPGKPWWRVIVSPFIPAGVIQLIVSLAGLWLYGRYAQLALPLPQVSVAGVYLTSAWIGALASANLNAYYLSCGALAGVCGLLGSICADQTVNFSSKKLWNMQEWWVVGGILILNVGPMVTISLFPLTCLWYVTAALLTGYLGTIAMLLLPRVGRGKPNNVKWASLQIFCALVVVVAFTAAIVGAAMPTKLGESVSFLKSAACVDFGGAMKCVPYGFLPDGCGIDLAGNGSYDPATLVCPSSGSITLPAGIPVPFGNANGTAALCTQYCSEFAPPPAPGWAPTTVVDPISSPPPASDASATANTTTTIPPAPTTAVTFPPPATATPPPPPPPTATFTPTANTTTPVMTSGVNLNIPVPNSGTVTAGTSGISTTVPTPIGNVTANPSGINLGGQTISTGALGSLASGALANAGRKLRAGLRHVHMHA